MAINSNILREHMRDSLSRYTDFIDENLSGDNKLLPEKFSELAYYYPRSSDKDEASYGWNIEKIKIFFELLKLADDADAKIILSYMEQLRYGWKGSIYYLSNTCLRTNHHCKKNRMIDSTPEATEGAFAAVRQIFFSEGIGKITTYLFGYCLSALFTSRLKAENRRVPYFLQIACEADSNIYRLIHEIVDICDVNTGMIENCDRISDYGYCNHDNVTVFPTQNNDKILNSLVCNRDIPVIIDGFENEKFYHSMLREVANIPSKREPLHVKDRFNILPVFICPVIKSRFGNIFSLDFNDIDVPDGYLELVQENKQMLASWALELIKDAEEYFMKRNTAMKKILLRTEEERPFIESISSHINYIRKSSRQYTELTPKDIANVGFLSYFISKYMDVFKNSIQLAGVEFMFDGKIEAHNTVQLVKSFSAASVKGLLDLHKEHSPMSSKKVTVETNEADSAKAKQIKKKGEDYAKNMVKYYQSYGVSIKVLPDAEFKDERYVFNVVPLPGTDSKLISRYADEVRRLLELEFFMPEINRSSIKIIVSEKPLKENSLIKILESQDFVISTKKIPYAVGYDIMGTKVIADIAEFPHLLIGGTTGSGKSSALHSMLMSIVCKQKASEVKLLLLDFGSSRLRMFADTPHLLRPVVSANEIEKGRTYINALQGEVDRRIDALEALNERERDKQLEKWPSIVFVIDEFPAFIRKLKAGRKNIHDHRVFDDILERSRKLKIHLILAAQDSTKGNIAIKTTNFGAAIAFRCTNWRDSMAIIDAPDARDLYGKGSMYFKCEEHEGLKRVQGAYMEPDEIMDMLESMEFDHSNDGYTIEGLDESKTPTKSDGDDFDSEESESDDSDLAEVIMFALRRDEISIKNIMDEYGMGHVVAKRDYFVKLEEYNLLSERKSNRDLKARKVIPLRVDEVPSKVVKFLARHGYSETDISKALNERPGSQLAAQNTSDGITAYADTESDPTPKQETHDADPEAVTPQALPNEAIETQPGTKRRNKRKNKKRR